MKLLPVYLLLPHSQDLFHRLRWLWAFLCPILAPSATAVLFWYGYSPGFTYAVRSNATQRTQPSPSRGAMGSWVLGLSLLLLLLLLSRFSRVRLCVTLWMVAPQVLLSMGFSRQEYWSGLLCPPVTLQLFQASVSFLGEFTQEIEKSYWIWMWICECWALAIKVLLISYSLVAFRS